MCHFMNIQHGCECAFSDGPRCFSVLAVSPLWCKIYFGENSTLLACAFLQQKETSETSYGIQYVRPSMRSRSIWPADPLGVSGVTQSLSDTSHPESHLFTSELCQHNGRRSLSLYRRQFVTPSICKKMFPKSTNLESE